MGFMAGLHTGGIYPARLARLLPLLDWVGLDIKASFATTGAPGSGDNARASLEMVLRSGVAHECRTTLDRRFLDDEALNEIAHSLAALGVRHYALQACRNAGGIDGEDWLKRVPARHAD